jgi:hypothetical protein
MRRLFLITVLLVLACPGVGTQAARALPKREASPITDAAAIRIAEGTDAYRSQARTHRGLYTPGPLKGPGIRELEYFHKSDKVVDVVIDSRTGRVREAWAGIQAEHRGARGIRGLFGRNVSRPYIWLPLCFLFLVPFFDPRRPFRLLHLDLVVLVGGFGASHFFFNKGALAASVPLVYPVLGYLLARMLFIGFRPRETAGRLVPVLPIAALAVGLVLLIGFRVGLNLVDSNVVDVGFAGAAGADRIVSGEDLYADSGPLDKHLDTYGPANYLTYVPFEAALPIQKPIGGNYEEPAAHAAAIAFDLAILIGIFLLGRQFRRGREGTHLGLALAFAWASFPYSLYTLESNPNDALVGALLVFTVLALSSPIGRGALLGVATMVKFGPAALAPLLARGREATRKSVVAFTLVFGAACAVLLLPFIPSGGFEVFWSQTIGYQLHRSSPFSIWGLHPSFKVVLPVVKAGVVALALAVAVGVRMRRDTVQVAALAAAVVLAVQIAATYWFYFYIAWFAPLVLFALFTRCQAVADRGRPVAHERPEPAPPPKLEASPVPARVPALLAISRPSRS